MAAFRTLKFASGLYAASSVSSSARLKFASLDVCSRGFSQIHAPANISTSKPSKKLTQRKAAPGHFSSEPAASVSSRKSSMGKPTSSRRLLPRLDPNPTPNTAIAPPQYPHRSQSRPPVTPAQYKSHRERIKKKFPEGWAPPRTISREAMEVVRALHAEDPVQYRTPVLANKFKISPEAVSRILKSKWRPSPARAAELIARENKNKDRWIAEKIRVERAEAAKSLKGRLDIVEKARGKDKLTMK